MNTHDYKSSKKNQIIGMNHRLIFVMLLASVFGSCSFLGVEERATSRQQQLFRVSSAGLYNVRTVLGNADIIAVIYDDAGLPFFSKSVDLYRVPNLSPDLLVPIGTMTIPADEVVKVSLTHDWVTIVQNTSEGIGRQVTLVSVTTPQTKKTISTAESIQGATAVGNKLYVYSHSLVKVTDISSSDKETLLGVYDAGTDIIAGILLNNAQFLYTTKKGFSKIELQSDGSFTDQQYFDTRVGNVKKFVEVGNKVFFGGSGSVVGASAIGVFNNHPDGQLELESYIEYRKHYCDFSVDETQTCYLVGDNNVISFSINGPSTFIKDSADYNTATNGLPLFHSQYGRLFFGNWGDLESYRFQ